LKTAFFTNGFLEALRVQSVEAAIIVSLALFGVLTLMRAATADLVALLGGLAFSTIALWLSWRAVEAWLAVALLIDDFLCCVSIIDHRFARFARWLNEEHNAEANEHGYIDVPLNLIRVRVHFPRS